MNPDNQDKVIRGFKGFDHNLQCKCLQYEVGKTAAVEGDLELCVNGLHFCLNPLCTFGYYMPCESRYAVVEADGEHILSEPDGEYNTTKRCTRSLKVVAELSVPDLVDEAINWMREHSGENPNVHHERYNQDRVKVTWVEDLHGYWVSDATLVVGTEQFTCVRNTGGGIALTLAGFSVASSESCWHSVAIAQGAESAAHTDGGGSIAITMGCSSAAICEADNSVAFVGAASIAIVRGRDSIATALFRGSKILLEGDCCMAMAPGNVEVLGHNCVVMLVHGYDHGAMIKATAGTKLFIPVAASYDHMEFTCGRSMWPADAWVPYWKLIGNYDKENNNV